MLQFIRRLGLQETMMNFSRWTQKGLLVSYQQKWGESKSSLDLEDKLKVVVYIWNISSLLTGTLKCDIFAPIIKLIEQLFFLPGLATLFFLNQNGANSQSIQQAMQKGKKDLYKKHTK